MEVTLVSVSLTWPLELYSPTASYHHLLKIDEKASAASFLTIENRTDLKKRAAKLVKTAGAEVEIMGILPLQDANSL